MLKKSIASGGCFVCNEGTSRVGICALSAARTGSCRGDEKILLRYKFRIPLLQRRGSPSCCSIFCRQFDLFSGEKKGGERDEQNKIVSL